MSATGMVVTVDGPLAADELGLTNAHEHLFLRSPALAGDELEALEPAIRELAEAGADGLRTVVEMTPIGCGRRPDLLRAASSATGMHIVGATGYHRDAHYPAGHWIHEAPIELLAQRIERDLLDGMHPRDWLDPSLPLDAARAGVIKAGASYHRISPPEGRRLAAVARAARRTGAPVLVHAEVGTAGHEILDALEGHGLSPTRVILAHMDRNPDAELHADICTRGAWLEYDTVGRTRYHPDSVVLDLVDALAGAGHLGRLMLGMDLGRRGYHRAHGGGPGMRYLLATFVPRLRKRLGDEGVRAIMVDNPARAFTMAAAVEQA